MSKSIHTTYSDLKGITKKEVKEQLNDPDSELSILRHKSYIKSEVTNKRKDEKSLEKLKKKNRL